MMQLDYLRMKNFRQYRDATIDFSRSPPDSFIIIQGVNGAGKTNILNAITWCLFEDECHADSKYAGLPIANTSALDANKKGIVEVSVELQFIGDDGKKLLFSRSINYKEKDGNPVEVPQAHAPPCVMMQTGREWIGPIYGGDAQYKINSLIPPEIEEYFFFDGERMDDYFKENTGKDIKDAVFEISQLELFNTLIEHLVKRKNEFVKKKKNLSSDAKNIGEDIDIQTQSLDSDREDLKKLEKEL